MKKPAISNRIVFHNLVLILSDTYLLLNLFSFRRTIIEENDLKQLYATEAKLQSGGNIDPVVDRVYTKLLSQKQILLDNVIAEIDAAQEQNASYTLGPARNIMIQLSCKCNLNCSYCYQKQYSSKEGVISSNEIRQIKEFVASYNKNDTTAVDKVIISGGEPLLEENISAINTIFKEFLNCKFHLYTNGINVLKFADKVDFKRFECVQLSLDGKDTIIGNLSQMPSICVYDQILEGIKYLKNCGCVVDIICMISQGIKEWLDIFLMDLLNKDILSDTVHLTISIPATYRKNETIDNRFFSIEEYVQIKKLLKSGKYSNYVSVSIPPAFSRIKNKAVRELNSRINGEIKICKSSEKTPLVFGPNGNVYWCACMEPNNGIVGDYHSGEINTDMLKQLGARNIFEIPQCRVCDMRYLCSSGCPYKLFATGQDLMSPVCGELDNETLVERLEDFIL